MNFDVFCGRETKENTELQLTLVVGLEDGSDKVATQQKAVLFHSSFITAFVAIYILRHVTALKRWKEKILLICLIPPCFTGTE